MKKNKNNKGIEKVIKEIDEEMERRTVGLKEEKIFSVDEAASLLGVEADYILKLVLERKIESLFIGRKYMLREEDLAEANKIISEEKPVGDYTIYTIAQVANILSLGTREITKLVNEGEIEGFKTRNGSRSPWRVKKEALDKYIERRIKVKKETLRK